MARPVIGIDARYAFRQERHGIGEYIYHLLEAYAEQAADLTFHLYLDSQAGPVPSWLATEQFRVTRLPVANPMLFEESAMPRAASRDRVALLHLAANYGGSMAAVPTVHTIHDLIEFMRQEIAPWRQTWRHGAGRWMRKRILPPTARRSRAIICPSESTKRDVERFLHPHPDRLTVIPYGVSGITPHPDPDRLRQKMRARGLLVPERYILVFAALDPRKNAEVVVRTFEHLSADFPGVELWLVGIEDPSRYPVGGGNAGVKVQPFLPRADALDLLRAATALIYPSLYEGFGLPVVEAMAAGVPVLASRSSSIPEVVGEAGILFDPATGDGLDAGLRLVLDNSGVAESLRLRGLARVASFTWEKSAAAHLGVYRQVVAERSEH